MQVEHLRRSFVYNGITLPDPGAALEPGAVKEFYGATYPELVNADIEGPERKAGMDVYTFRKAVGTKGSESGSGHGGTSRRPEVAKLSKLLKARNAGSGSLPSPVPSPAAALAALQSRRHTGAPEPNVIPVAALQSRTAKLLHELARRAHHTPIDPLLPPSAALAVLP